MKVSEIFYSIQGEGGRAGEPSVFVRLTGCSAKHACLQSGVVCDTEYESGKELTLVELHKDMLQAIQRVTGALPGETLPWVIWTGGEPLDQLTIKDVIEMKRLGWAHHAIETSGVRPMDEEFSEELEYIVISPKVAEHVLVKHFPWAALNKDGSSGGVHELRYVRHAGQPGVPVPSLHAVHHYLSPHSNGLEIDPVNVKHCIALALENPTWRVSVQMHKVMKVL
jgi:7-carboxy-7-deazaguanine synthase